MSNVFAQKRRGEPQSYGGLMETNKDTIVQMLGVSHRQTSNMYSYNQFWHLWLSKHRLKTAKTIGIIQWQGGAPQLCVGL